MEARLVLWIHEHASPWLDRLFVLSHWMGDERFVSTLVLAFVALHLWRRERRRAILWLALGLSTVAILLAVKPWALRARPELWPWIVEQGGLSFPSGHAIAAATFYPLIAYDVATRFKRLARPVWAAAIGVACFVGVGRVYLGVHWPTDVLAGWAIGATQLMLGLAWLRRGRSASGSPA